MSWRIIALQNPSRLSLRTKQLVINQNSEEFTLPVEDLCDCGIASSNDHKCCMRLLAGKRVNNEKKRAKQLLLF